MKLKHLLLCIALLISIASLSAYGETIYAIKVEGNKSTSAELATSAIGIRVGKDIIVLAFAERVSRYAKTKDGCYTIIQIELEGEKRVIFTGSSVLKDQLNTYRSELPFRAQIALNKTYYTFTGATNESVA